MMPRSIRPGRAAIAPLLLSLALGACTVMGPDYRRAQLDLPASYPAPAGAPSGAAPADAARVPADWWTLYRST